MSAREGRKRKKVKEPRALGNRLVRKEGGRGKKCAI
jgi:hypothetical protein